MRGRQKKHSYSFRTGELDGEQSAFANRVYDLLLGGEHSASEHFRDDVLKELPSLLAEFLRSDEPMPLQIRLALANIIDGHEDPPVRFLMNVRRKPQAWRWRLRKLAGLLTTPTLRPNGTLLIEPGYDAETRLLLMDPPELPAMSPNPSMEEARFAIDLLDRLLDGFPFVNDASRSVALPHCLFG